MSSKVYNIFVQYFDNPTFTKTKNTSDHTIYMCKLNVHLANATRYLVCIVPRDVFFVGDTQPLSNLKWVSFQTRSLSEPFNVKLKHGYQAKHQAPFNSKIIETSRDQNEVKYRSLELPLEISLLITDKLMYDYPSEGRLNGALETYNTIVIII